MKTLSQGTRSDVEILERVSFKVQHSCEFSAYLKLSSSGSMFQVLRYPLSNIDIFSHVIGSNLKVHCGWILNYKSIIICPSPTFLIYLMVLSFVYLSFFQIIQHLTMLSMNHIRRNVSVFRCDLIYGNNSDIYLEGLMKTT